jgi:hypothetical protein
MSSTGKIAKAFKAISKRLQVYVGFSSLLKPF